MGSPNRNRPETMVEQQYDMDPVTTGTWTPKAGRAFARGFYVISSASLTVTTAGTEDWPGTTGLVLQAAMLPVGAKIPLAITAITAGAATVQPYY